MFSGLLPSVKSTPRSELFPVVCPGSLSRMYRKPRGLINNGGYESSTDSTKTSFFGLPRFKILWGRAFPRHPRGSQLCRERTLGQIVNLDTQVPDPG